MPAEPQHLSRDLRQSLVAWPAWRAAVRSACTSLQGTAKFKFWDFKVYAHSDDSDDVGVAHVQQRSSAVSVLGWCCSLNPLLVGHISPEHQNAVRNRPLKT